MAAVLMSLLSLYLLTAWSSAEADENAYQQFIGCAFSNQGQAGHFWRYAYNSKDVMHVDLERETMVSTSNAGRFLTEERKSMEYIKRKEKRLRKLCTAVQMVFSLSNSSLSRAVKPAVRVQLGGEQGHEFLACLVHGFYPNIIRLRWTRDGKNIYYGASTTGVLPHKDGTFQMTGYLSLGNTSVQGVACEIEHISIDGKMRVTLEEKSVQLLWSVVIAMLAGIAFPVGSTVVIIWLKRKKASKAPEETSNDSSEASTPPSASLMHLPAEQMYNSDA